MADCNKQADGRYTINYVKLPTDANQQRELIVRRLAAEDDEHRPGRHGRDLDRRVRRGRLDPAVGGRAAQPRPRRASSRARSRRCEYQGKVWAIPFTSNTQLLWYRKDRVDPPPEDFTWDEMIDDAVEKGTAVEVQARQYEGLTVWINSLIAGAGGQIVDQNGDVKVDDTAKRAAEIDEQARQRPRPRRPACPPTRRTRRARASSRGAPTTR